MTDQGVGAAIEGRAGVLRLERPQALNALNRPMIAAMSGALDGWRRLASVAAVIIESGSPRAFCAGGDIRAVRGDALAGDHAAVEAFFSDEYRLNAALAEYPKPIVALIDGICMGGGLGISVHGAVRVVTEAAVLAMPETAIGMFPDIGATYFLPRLPGRLGMFLGLTGTRLEGADAVHAGLATHFVPRARLPELRSAIIDGDLAALDRHAAPLPGFTLATHLDAIGRCFAAGSVAEIVSDLTAENSDWSRATLAMLEKSSPSALCWSFAAIRRGALMSLREALDAELRLTRQVTRHPDFAEGVRAMVVDKDRQPRWSPTRLADVDAQAIAAMLG